mgnify:CR=1 FL=1
MSVSNAKNHKPLIIGLTGGLASGKSTATAYLKSKGFFVIDSDHIVKKLYQTEKEMLKQIKNAFNIEIKTKADKKALAKIVFNDQNQREKLNQIVHPYVFDRINEQLKQMEQAQIIFIDMPLLFEVKYESKCDHTMLIYCSEALQIKRLMTRERIDIKEATKRVQTQMPIEIKKEKADIIVDNQHSFDYLYQQLDQVLGAFIT